MKKENVYEYLQLSVRKILRENSERVIKLIPSIGSYRESRILKRDTEDIEYQIIKLFLRIISSLTSPEVKNPITAKQLKSLFKTHGNDRYYEGYNDAIKKWHRPKKNNS